MRWIAALFLFAVCAEEKKPRPGRIYDTGYGSVYCAEMNIGTCGVYLARCHDGTVYHCMLNVREHEPE